MINEQTHRYSRQTSLLNIGEAGQNKLFKASVLVVGAGGLGCPVLQYLVAAGIGKITLIDGDVVDISNLQRQILYDETELGKPKVLIAQKKLNKANSDCKIEALHTYLNPENALELIQNSDIVVDCTDNFSTRYLINDACVIANKPFVSGALATFEGQVSVFNYKNGPTYRCLYPSMPSEEVFPNCGVLGVLGTLTGIIGSIMASETIKMITGIGKVLSGELLIYNSLDNSSIQLHITKNSENTTIKSLQSDYTHCDTSPISTNMENNLKEITAEELKKLISNNADIQIIDVRDAAEYQKRNIGGQLIPISKLTEQVDKIDKNKQVIIHCGGGSRSKRAIQLLEKEYGFTNLYNLKNGLKNWKD